MGEGTLGANEARFRPRGNVSHILKQRLKLPISKCTAGAGRRAGDPVFASWPKDCNASFQLLSRDGAIFNVSSQDREPMAGVSRHDTAEWKQGRERRSRRPALPIREERNN